MLGNREAHCLSSLCTSFVRYMRACVYIYLDCLRTRNAFEQCSRSLPVQASTITCSSSLEDGGLSYCRRVQRCSDRTPMHRSRLFPTPVLCSDYTAPFRGCPGPIFPVFSEQIPPRYPQGEGKDPPLSPAFLAVSGAAPWRHCNGGGVVPYSPFRGLSTSLIGGCETEEFFGPR